MKFTDQTQQASRTWRRVKVCALTGYLLGVGLSLSYSTELRCDAVQRLTNLARQNFAQSTDQSLQQPQLGADACSVALGEAGARIYFCSWGFDYRSGEARQYFSELERELLACLKPSSAPQGDQQVNHPDSFIQQTYTVNGVDLSISVKDKSPLQKTFVFFRAQRTGDSGQ